MIYNTAKIITGQKVKRAITGMVRLALLQHNHCYVSQLSPRLGVIPGLGEFHVF